MKKLLAIFCLFALCEISHATTTVTGTLQNLGTGTVTNSFVRFWLRGCKGANPRINGTAVIAPSQQGIYYFDIPADAVGHVSGTLYSTRDAAGSGNGEIECWNSKLAEWYGMQVYVKGQAGPEVAVHAQNGVTMDISNVIPISTPGMGTAGNSPLGAGIHVTTSNLDSPTSGFCVIWLPDHTQGEVACSPSSQLPGTPGQYYATNPGATALTLQNKISYDTRDYGVVSDGSTNDTVKMNALLTTIGSNPATLIFPAGQTLLGNITLPANVSPDFSSGGSLKAITSSTSAGGGAFVQGTGCTPSSPFNNCTATLSGTIAGNTILVMAQTPFASLANLPSDGVNSYILLSQSSTAVGTIHYLWAAAGIAGGSAPVNCSAPGGTFVTGCIAWEVSGLGPLVKSDGFGAFNFGTITTMSSGSTTLLTGDFVIGFGGQHYQVQTCTAGAGYTQPAGAGGSVGAGAVASLCAEYNNAGAGGATSATQTINNAITGGQAWQYEVQGVRPGSATITILGGINNPDNHQIFYNAAGTGIIDFTGNTKLPWVYPEWWGASPTASAATNTAALQAAEHGAFGFQRTNASGLTKWNRGLYLSQNYSINDELQFYSVNGFKVTCAQRLGAGITQTAANKRIIDGQSISYGTFEECAWATSAAQDTSHPLIDLDYDGVSTNGDLRPQFVDFDRNTFTGASLANIGVQIAKSGGGAQGSNIYCKNCAASGFSTAAWRIGTPTSYAQNALDIGWYGGDIQSSPLYGIASYGGGFIFTRDVTFENGFATQTGFDQYCEAPQGSCIMEHVRSESRRLIAGGTLRVLDSFTINQATIPTPGGSLPVGTIIRGSNIGGDGAYYKVTVNGGAPSPFGGVGTAGSPQSATSGSATTIVNSGAAYTVSAFVGYKTVVSAGTGLGQTCIVTANDATTITCAAGWTNNFPPLFPVSPDATSRFFVEPNYGTQFTSGGMVWVALAENGIEGSLGGVAGDVVLNRVIVPGDKIFATGVFKNLTVSRGDWLTQDISDNTVNTNDIDNVLNSFPLATSGGNIYRKWTLPRASISVPYTGYSQHNVGTLPMVWSAGVGGGAAVNDVWIGGRSDPNSATNVSRAVLEYGGILGAPTPQGTDIAGSPTRMQGGLSTGSGAPGDIEFWTGVVGGSGTTPNAGSAAVKITQAGMGFVKSKGQHFTNQAAASDMAGTCTFSSTTCTVTFTTAYTATPSCVANDRTAAAPIQSAPTTANVVFTGGTGAGATDVINYVCVGNPN